jgi:hypothetical protein
MSQFERVTELLRLVPSPPGEELPAGITAPRVRAVANRLRTRFPEELVEWLGVSNGPCVGPGGLFGVETGRDFLDIEYVTRLFPHWIDKGWIPVAGDGNGNYYVLLNESDRHPVGFVEASVDADSLGFVVASSLSKFLEALLKKEVGRDTGWPFDRATVVAHDPEIQRLGSEFTLPWESR